MAWANERLRTLICGCVNSIVHRNGCVLFKLHQLLRTWVESKMLSIAMIEKGSSICTPSSCEYACYTATDIQYKYFKILRCKYSIRAQKGSSMRLDLHAQLCFVPQRARGSQPRAERATVWHVVA
jgi:hypothetical protein